MRQQLIEFLLTQHRAKSGLRELGCLVDIVRDFHDCLPRFDHAQEDHGVNLQSDVVAGDDVLRKDFEGFLAQRNANNPVDRREYQNDAVPFGRGQQPTQAKDYAAFIFSQYFDGTEKVDNDNDDQDSKKSKRQFHKCLHDRSAEHSYGGLYSSEKKADAKS